MTTDISIIIPVYNEEESLEELHNRLTKAIGNAEYEILFVNDGSTDGSINIIRNIIKKDRHTKLISLRKNIGKSLALNTGFSEAQGGIVVTLDADLQDEPDMLKNFIDKINEGYDVVCGWRETRHDRLEKKLASAFFNLIVSKTTKLKLHDFNCGYKAYRKNVIKTISIYGEMHRFIPVIAAEYGFRITEIKIKHNQRKYGISKYGMKRYFSGFFDFLAILFLQYFHRKPLHFIGMPGLIFLFTGIALIGYTAFMKFILGETGVRPSLLVGLTSLMVSLQIFSIGFAAELITFLFHKDRNYISSYISSRESSEKHNTDTL